MYTYYKCEYKYDSIIDTTTSMNIDISANLYINIIFLEIFPSIVIFTVIQLGSAILRCFRAFASEAVRIQTAKSLEMRLDSLTCLGDGGGLIQVTGENSLLAVAVRLCFSFFLNGEEGGKHVIFLRNS